MPQVPRAGSCHTDGGRRPLRPGGFCPEGLSLRENTARCVPTAGTALPTWPRDAPDVCGRLWRAGTAQFQGAPGEQGGDTAVTPAVTPRENQGH